MSKSVMIKVFFALTASVFPLKAQWTLLLSESFDTWGPYASSPPSNWTINFDGTASANDWHNASWHWGWSGPPVIDGGVVTLFWEPGENGLDEFISPAIDCSDCDEVWIAFDHSYNHYRGAYTARVLGSINGGGTWPDLIWNYNGLSYGGLVPERDSFDISSWAQGESDVCFNWRGEGNNTSINVWNFDDVIVYGFQGTPAWGFDLHVAQVIRPSVKETGGIAIKPACRIYNNADSIAHADVRCRLKDVRTQVTVYDRTAHDYPLDPGYTVVDTFASFTPDSNMRYEVFFVLEHPDDVNAGNNDKTRYCCTACDKVSPTVIISPGPTESAPFSPTATFREGAGALRTSANLHSKITSIASHDVVYIQSVTNNSFGENQQKDVEFPAAVLTDGEYEITFWASDREDGDISDPDLVDTFNYASGVTEINKYGPSRLVVSDQRVVFTLSKDTPLNLALFDVAGKLVATVADGFYPAGTYGFDIPVTLLTAGVYFARLLSPDWNTTGKVIVIN